MSNLLAKALRQKFSDPREALKALGLDENLLTETRMSKTTPTKFAATAAQLLGAVIGPLLAKDAKIDLTPVFAGMTHKTFDKKKVRIALDSALKGKIAKDAEPNMGHVASMLDHIEHMSKPEVADESASQAQHNAMEAAAHGTSNLGIPKKVGEEFSEADKGKGFDEGGFRAFLKEKGVGDEDIEKACDMLPKPATEGGMGGADEGESEEEKKKREEEEAKKKAADEAEAKAKEEREAADKAAKDKKAMDAAMKNMVTRDEAAKMANDAVAKANETQRQIRKAMSDVKPWVGEFAEDTAMAFDSAEKVHRAAAKMLGVKRADTMHADALLDVIQAQPRPGTQKLGNDGADPSLAMDAAGTEAFDKMFGGSHITQGSGVSAGGQG